MYSTCIHAVSTCARVVHVHVLLLTVLIVNMITLHLWDTGSVGIPIDKQITCMAEFWDCFRCLDTEYTCTLLLMIKIVLDNHLYTAVFLASAVSIIVFISH